MSYCYFPTVLLGLLLAHRALGSDVVVALREQKARSLIPPPIVGRAIADARSMQHPRGHRRAIRGASLTRLLPCFIAQWMLIRPGGSGRRGGRE
jgi:hypothetical protein